MFISGLLGYYVLDFLLAIIELFSLGVMAELGITSENRSEIGNFAPMRLVSPKISGRKGRPNNYSCTVS